MQPIPTIVPAKTQPGPVPQDLRAAKILAKSMFKDMVANGMSPEQILSVASELIASVTLELKQAQEPPPGQA